MVLNCRTLLTHDFFDYCFLDLWFLSSECLDLGAAIISALHMHWIMTCNNSSGTSV
jgi:hypothetical protein